MYTPENACLKMVFARTQEEPPKMHTLKCHYPKLIYKFIAAMSHMQTQFYCSNTQYQTSPLKILHPIERK